MHRLRQDKLAIYRPAELLLQYHSRLPDCLGCGIFVTPLDQSRGADALRGHSTSGDPIDGRLANNFRRKHASPRPPQ